MTQDITLLSRVQHVDISGAFLKVDNDLGQQKVGGDFSGLFLKTPEKCLELPEWREIWSKNVFTSFSARITGVELVNWYSTPVRRNDSWAYKDDL